MAFRVTGASHLPVRVCNTLNLLITPEKIISGRFQLTCPLLVVTEINECLSQPCLNGGACRDSVGSYHCQCNQGFSGTRCQTGRASSRTSNALMPKVSACTCSFRLFLCFDYPKT